MTNERKEAGRRVSPANDANEREWGCDVVGRPHRLPCLCPASGALALQLGGRCAETAPNAFGATTPRTGTFVQQGHGDPFVKGMRTFHLLCTAALLGLCSIKLARADNYPVTNTNDSGAGSLRQAIV